MSFHYCICCFATLLLTFFLNYCLFFLQADLYSPRCYPEQVELPVADLLISSTDQTSPPCSPSNSDFTPSTPSAWEFGEVEFQLEEEEEEEHSS